MRGLKVHLTFASALLLCCVACGGGTKEGAEAIMGEGKAKEPVVYLALGDSTGVGVGAPEGGGYPARLLERIERVRPGSRLVNLCVSGATTADLLSSQVGRVGEARPGLVTVGVGINDVSRQVAPEQFARNYEEIVTRLRAQTDAPVVLTNLPDISHAPAVPVFFRDEARRRLELFNARIAEVAARHGLTVADTYAKSTVVIHKHPEFFSPDGFHPSEEGYEFWAFEMWPAVKAAIGEE